MELEFSVMWVTDEHQVVNVGRTAYGKGANVVWLAQIALRPAAGNDAAPVPHEESLALG